MKTMMDAEKMRHDRKLRKDKLSRQQFDRAVALLQKTKGLLYRCQCIFGGPGDVDTCVQCEVKTEISNLIAEINRKT